MGVWGDADAESAIFRLVNVTDRGGWSVGTPMDTRSLNSSHVTERKKLVFIHPTIFESAHV